MATDVQDFYDKVSSALNRGTSYDTLIPTYAARALRFLEQNYPFEYMKVSDPDYYNILEGVREYEYPPQCKSFRLWRIYKDDGTFHDLTKVPPEDVTATDTDIPNGYYTDSRDSIVLDNEPDEDYTAVLFFNEFTDWTEVELGDSPYIVVNGEGLFLAQTVIEFGPKLRDPKLLSLYGDNKKEALRVMALSEETATQEDEAPEMSYS